VKTNTRAGGPWFEILFGIAGLILGGLDGFPAQDIRSLVLPVAIGGSSSEAEEDDVGLELADDADDVADHPWAIPFLQRFFRAFRESKIDCAGEELFGAIDAPGGEKLFGPDGTEQRSFFRADRVLSAFSAG
jgi:hypothetical protein